MTIQEVRVINHSYLPDPKGEEILYEIRDALRISSVQKVRTARVFRFEGITADEADFLANKLLAEEVFQAYQVNQSVIKDADVLLEVAYQPGVMNPEAASILKSAKDLGITGLVAADSSWEYGFWGTGITPDEIKQITDKLLVNATVERVVTEKPKTLVISGQPGITQIVPIRKMNDEELLDLSKDKLFLNLEEMKVIQTYFISLDRDPTDCEIETIAQTWSEHCGHKTFRAKLIVDGREKKPLLKRLQEATKQANHPLVLSAFVDNSGVMEFYDGHAICGKVETHNSPSAIEPYGGAMTGSGGVFRDVMGTGQGAKVISSTDMFCFAPPWMSTEEIPPGCLHPHYLLRRVVAGVRDYGNRMGIPTNNGSVHFHPDFRAKPTVIVGAYGILPASQCQKGSPEVGDIAVVLGGRTGRDGIHGATFSSAEMTDRTVTVNSSAVQIGNAIEEKRVSDAILVARDEGLIRAITDCGAGGYGSALGEMGEKVGVKVTLERVPLKYSGLNPWEIWQSESQERMVMAVAPENLERVLEICSNYNVEATAIGEFTGDGRLVVSYNGETVCDLDMGFLHDGLPQRVLKASWQKPSYAEPEVSKPVDWEKTYCDVMSHLNVCSKEPIVRVYDHGVQGSSALLPFTGVEYDGPNDAVVITPILDKPYGVVISHGLNPVLNKIDPYYGSLWAAVEAVSNAVASGANPSDLTLIDNFIWPFPDEEALGALDKAVDACVDFVKVTGMPFISGKDSLSSTYRGQDGSVLKIPPVLCVSVFGRIEDVQKTVSTDFKKVGSKIVLLGERNIYEMAGSVYYDIAGYIGNNLPRINLKQVNNVFHTLHRAISGGSVLACHDISEGGLAAALAEMCFGGKVGAEIVIPKGEKAEYHLFNETAGCFIVEIPAEIAAEELFAGVPYTVIGTTTAKQSVSVSNAGNVLFDIPLSSLKTAWQEPMKGVFR
ncbi:phosphoribosylformylglycinamidine synthase subunit PurL [Desulfolucanica intricata]|uniref:phosphoribosylformylglycinamidine synthase subunit PurL n=1 Tax=Desulfolucanica intricata TaxID=1285191 RepID=UPI00082CEDFD|nr:phosphoribosylformylglycinamidine synthase subunit PurL [Desulfolucanica intricata]